MKLTDQMSKREKTTKFPDSIRKIKESKKSMLDEARINIIWSCLVTRYLFLFEHQRLFRFDSLLEWERERERVGDGWKDSFSCFCWFVILWRTLAIKCVIQNCEENDLSSSPHFDTHRLNELFFVTNNENADNWVSLALEVSKRIEFQQAFHYIRHFAV